MKKNKADSTTDAGVINSSDTIVLRVARNQQRDKLKQIAPPMELELIKTSKTSTRFLSENWRSNPIYQQFMCTVYDGLIIADVAGSILDANSRLLNLIGFPLEDVTGRNITEFFEAIDADSLRDVIRAVSIRRRVVVEGRCLTVDGEGFNAEMTMDLVEFSRDQRHLCLHIRDISRRVAMTAALTDSEQRFRDIAESMSNWIWETDRRGVCIFCTDRVTSVLGRPVQDVVGRDFCDFVSKGDKAMVSALSLRQALIGGREPFRNLELWLDDTDGCSRCISLSGCPIFEESHFRGFRGVASDVTERKTIELELARHQESLEAEVERRTAELSEAMKRLEAINLEKDQFLANMSHEIRTPMNAIIGVSGLLGDLATDADQKEHVSVIQGAGESLLSIINDVLDFSKISANRLELDDADFSVVDIVDEVVALLSVSANAKGLLLAASCDSNLPSIFRGDPGRFRQVLVNMVGNAIKFTPEGHVIVKVTHNQGAEGSLVHVSVEDTGPGIKAEDVKRLFRQFGQLDNSATREHGGTGLGLAICAKLCTLMHGKTGVESTVGRGAQFWFELPLGVVEGAKPLQSALAKQRVALFSQSTALLSILKNQLEAWRAEVVDLSLDEFGQEIELAIVDAKVPGGIELINQFPQNVTVVVVGGAPGEASRPFVTLPVRYSRNMLFLALTGQLGVAPGREAGEASARGCGDWPSSRILIVEDNSVNQWVMGKMLARRGCQFDVVSNGLEAVEAVISEGYDLVLMDCHMPVMDGFEAVARIREREREFCRQRTPVVAVTAGSIRGDREKCLAAGMDGYLSKPIRTCELDSLLHQWLLPQDANYLEEPQSASVYPILDFAHLDAVIDDDLDFYDEFAEIFIQTVPDRLRQLELLLDVPDDPEAIIEAAHSLQGACLNFGAFRLREKVYALEVGASSDGLPEAITGFADWNVVWDKTLDAMNRYRSALVAKFSEHSGQ